ncbi:MAG: cysteate synthase, partial [Bacteroidales bacterium]|nr:cysteate synthase [Bacteroidales bacterium]
KVTNSELAEWKQRFLELEGVDIYSAAAVAVASLGMAVKDGTVGRDDMIMLNITGGGEALCRAHHQVVSAEPHLVLDPTLPEDEIISRVRSLFE